MTRLTTAQLAELTELANRFLEEWQFPADFVISTTLPPGIVRLLHDVTVQWYHERGEALATEQARDLSLTTEIATDVYEEGKADGYAAGYEKGYATGYEVGMAERKVEAEPKPPTKSEFFGFRASAEEHQQLKEIADELGANGNISAAARHVIDSAPEPPTEPPPKSDGKLTNAPELPAQDKPVDKTVNKNEAEIVQEPNGYHPITTALAQEPPALSANAAATLGPEHTVVTPLKPHKAQELATVELVPDDDDDLDETRTPQRTLDLLARQRRQAAEMRDRKARLDAQRKVTREQLVAEVKRQGASSGVMPSQIMFNTSKPAVWPTATALMTALHTSWESLREEAGLKPRVRGTG